MNENLQKWLPWVVAGLLALILAVVLVINSGGEDVAMDETTTTDLETTTTIGMRNLGNMMVNEWDGNGPAV